MTLDIATLGASGISAAQLITTQEGTDTLTLTAPAAIDSDSLLDPFEELILTDGGTTRFRGWLDQAPRAATGGQQTLAYTLAGPMRWLERTTYGTTETGGKDVLGLPTTESPTAATPLDTVIRRILARVDTDTESAITWTDSDLDEGIFQHEIPPEVRRDNNCADLLRRALKFAPTVAYWWDYSSTTPRLRFKDIATNTADKTLATSGYAISQATINPRFDLLHNRVRISWQKQNDIVRTDLTASSGNAHTLGANRIYAQTFEVGRYNIPTAGLADVLQKHVSKLHVDATATLEALDWTHRPGLLWAFGAPFAPPSLPTAKSFGYEVTRDLFARRQTLSLGVPPSHGIYKLSDGNNDNPPPPEDPAVTGDPFHGVDVSVGGSNLIRVIYGTISGEPPSGMSEGDDPPYTLTASGTKSVYAIVTINTSTGAITSRSLGHATSVPSDSDSTFFFELFSYTVSGGTISISQSVAGSLTFSACRDWYSNPVTWSPTWGAV